MAGDAADLLDLQEHRVRVAVEPQLAHFLHVTGLLALVPQPAARARPVHGLARRRRLFERRAIHPGDSQHPPAGRILRHRGHQPVAVPRHFVEPAHSRTSMPCVFMCAFASRTVNSPKWKMLAASTASALPSSTPCARCSRLPTPPEAITGTLTASDTARVRPTSKPARVPSRSMLVKRISPAPVSTMRFAHCTASSPVARRPPCVKTSQPEP